LKADSVCAPITQTEKKSEVIGRRVPIDLHVNDVNGDPGDYFQPRTSANTSQNGDVRGGGYASSSLSHTGDDGKSNKGSWAGSSVRSSDYMTWRL